jgi:ATP-dependent RNA helicase DDX51/DBP6
LAKYFRKDPNTSRTEPRPAMASQLYPRYVPVKKKARESTAINSSTASLQATSTSTSQLPLDKKPTTKPDASATYARYIPPSSKSQTRSITVANDVRPKPPVTSKRKHENNAKDSIEQHPSKTSKKKVESKPLPVPLVQEPRVGEGDSVSHPAPEKKERKRKRKIPDEDVEDVASTLDLDSSIHKVEDARHKIILSKREKSLKKAERFAQTAAKVAAEKDGDGDSAIEEQAVEVHPLEPLPQPEPVPELEGKPTFSALPPWLASPIRISSSATSSFAELGIPTEAINVLQSKGFSHAFAIQASVLPLLLPGNKERGDILVSAATGSGKTLAYVLPMVENISHFTVTRLRGLIIMPTRELVTQAREICDICATAYASSSRTRIKVGVAIGSQQLKVEQIAIMNEEQRYDPEEYQRRERLANAKWELSSQETDGEDLNLYEEKHTSAIPNHIVEHSSKVDILISTPGRLVEHLKSTPGFNLDFINWLVIDEADKLLDQSFQQWLDVVMPSLGRRAKSSHPQRAGRAGLPSVTKVVLSATVTRDLGQLSALKLYRPKLVVLEGVEGADGISDETYNLPNSLHESAIKVENESDKPLYLLELINSYEMVEHTAVASPHISSGDDSDSSDEISSSSSDNDSSGGEIESIGADAEDSEAPESLVTKESKKSTKNQSHEPYSQSRGVLIFTKSNENAVRLSRLLSLLDLSITHQIGTLTSTIRSSVRIATLHSFQRGKLSILIASDLVSRGLDIPHLAHVINYDIPTSLTSYIHRVGRTARAGREGHAWTLYSKTEARWFWNEIARNALVVRGAGRKVERVSLATGKFGEDEKQRYEAALIALGKEASESQPAGWRMKE